MTPKMLPSMLLLVVMLVPQSLAASQSIFSNQRQLQVRTEPSRSAIVVSRAVTAPTEAPPVGSSTILPADNTTASTTISPGHTTPKSEMTGKIEVAFGGIRECHSNSSEVSGHAFYQFNSIPDFLSSLLPSEYQLLSSNGVRGECKKSRGVLFNSGSSASNGTFIRAVTAEMCSVESTGTLYLGGEVMKVTDGQFLLSVLIEGWQQEGHFLEFNLTMAVPDGYKISTNSSTVANVPVKVSLGTNDSFVMISSKSMTDGYPMLTYLDEDAVRANVTVRVPRDGTGDRLTIITLIVEPGYISSEHVKPRRPTSAASRYLGTPSLVVATAVFFVMACMFSRR